MEGRRESRQMKGGFLEEETVKEDEKSLDGREEGEVPGRAKPILGNNGEKW